MIWLRRVLNLSASERYEDDFTPQKTELSQCIAGACSSLKGKAARYGVTIESRLEETYVLADKENMTTIFLNLIDNAIKYNRKGGSIRIGGYTDDVNAVVDSQRYRAGNPAGTHRKDI